MNSSQKHLWIVTASLAAAMVADIVALYTIAWNNSHLSLILDLTGLGIVVAMVVIGFLNMGGVIFFDKAIPS